MIGRDWWGQQSFYLSCYVWEEGHFFGGIYMHNYEYGGIIRLDMVGSIVQMGRRHSYFKFSFHLKVFLGDYKDIHDHCRSYSQGKKYWRIELIIL